MKNTKNADLCNDCHHFVHDSWFSLFCCGHLIFQTHSLMNTQLTHKTRIIRAQLIENNVNKMEHQFVLQPNIMFCQQNHQQHPTCIIHLFLSLVFTPAIIYKNHNNLIFCSYLRLQEFKCTYDITSYWLCFWMKSDNEWIEWCDFDFQETWSRTQNILSRVMTLYCNIKKIIKTFHTDTYSLHSLHSHKLVRINLCSLPINSFISDFHFCL